MKHLLITTIAAVLLIGCGFVLDAYVSAQEGDSEAKAAKALGVSSVVAASFEGSGNYTNYTVNAILLFVVFAVYDCARVYFLCCARSLQMEKVDNVKDQDKYLNYITIAILLLTVLAVYVLHKKDLGRPLREAASSGNTEVVKQLSYTGADLKDIVSLTPFEKHVARNGRTDITDLLRKHVGKTAKELKAEGK